MNPEWVAALCALVVAVCTGAAFALRWAWRILRRVVHFLDDYSGQPARDGMEARPGLMARLGSVEEQLKHVVAETSPNHGRSIRDLVIKTAADVTVIKDEQAKIKQRIDGMTP